MKHQATSVEALLSGTTTLDRATSWPTMWLGCHVAFPHQHRVEVCTVRVPLKKITSCQNESFIWIKLYHISLVIRQGFIPLPKPSLRSRSVLEDRSRSLGLFWNIISKIWIHLGRQMRSLGLLRKRKTNFIAKLLE